MKSKWEQPCILLYNPAKLIWKLTSTSGEATSLVPLLKSSDSEEHSPESNRCSCWDVCSLHSTLLVLPWADCDLDSFLLTSVIKALKFIFSQYGVPSVFMSDNGPQFVSHEMKEFDESYGFTLMTRSPYYPQSNKLAERTIQTIKGLLRHSPNPYLALLSFRATPIPWCSFSSAQLLIMGRQIRTDIPTPKNQLIPQWPYLADFREKNKEYKAKQKRDYDERHRTRPLDPLLADTPVWWLQMVKNSEGLDNTSPLDLQYRHNPALELS